MARSRLPDAGRTIGAGRVLPERIQGLRTGDPDAANGFGGVRNLYTRQYVGFVPGGTRETDSPTHPEFKRLKNAIASGMQIANESLTSWKRRGFPSPANRTATSGIITE